jgi:hypothetical protein
VFVFFVGVFSSEYLPMAVFVEDVDKLFDSFNSVKHAAPGKALRSPLSDNSPHIGHWTKASMGIKSWIFLQETDSITEWLDYRYWCCPACVENVEKCRFQLS